MSPKKWWFSPLAGMTSRLASVTSGKMASNLKVAIFSSSESMDPDINPLIVWDQAPHWGKKEQKSASEASLGVVRGGALSNSPGHRWARFARRYFIFFLFDPGFLPFSSTAKPGPRLLPLKFASYTKLYIIVHNFYN